MGKLFVWEFLSLDGVTESPEKWTSTYNDEALGEFIKVQNLACDALLLGRLTYEAFITFWPHQTGNAFGFSDHLNAMPKYVMSNTLQTATWNNTHILKGDAAEAVTKLKQQYANQKIGLTGSPTLIQALIAHDLIDEYHLMVYPVVLGGGQRLFEEGAKANLQLVERQPFKSGVVALSYTVSH